MTHGVGVYGLFINTVHLIWRFCCCNADPTIYRGNLLQCFWPVFISPACEHHGKLHDVISAQETAHPDMVFIVAGDFNYYNLKTVFPKYHQHVDIPTRDKNTLYHIYSNKRGVFRAAPRPHCTQPSDRDLNGQTLSPNRLNFGHIYVFKAAAILEDSSVSVQNYAEYVTGYISTCVDNIVSTIQVKKFPNQKPWINCRVRCMLHACTTVFIFGNQTEYKAAKCGLRRAITDAKRQYKEKLGGFYSSADFGQMWQGLQQITEYRNTTSIISSSDSLPDDLINFYSHFEITRDITGRSHHTWPTQPSASHPPTVSSVQVLKTLNRINHCKATGSDNIPGQALRTCANELADVFTSIFNLPLIQSTVPSCFKTTTIVPLPKKSPPTCLNNYRPIALTPIIMKCFERVILADIKSTMLDTLDPCSMPTGPIDPPQMLLLLPSTTPCPT